MTKILFLISCICATACGLALIFIDTATQFQKAVWLIGFAINFHNSLQN